MPGEDSSKVAVQVVTNLGRDERETLFGPEDDVVAEARVGVRHEARCFLAVLRGRNKFRSEKTTSSCALSEGRAPVGAPAGSPARECRVAGRVAVLIFQAPDGATEG